MFEYVNSRIFFFSFSFFFAIGFFLFTTQNFDVLYRSNISESILSFFHFFWTSSWYIPLFFFFTLVALGSFFAVNVYFVYAVIILIFYFAETQHLWYSNHSFIVFNVFLNDYNSLLLNNLNKYHPYFLYSSAQLVLILFPYTQFFFLHLKKNYFHLNFFRVIFFSKVKIGALQVLVALVLGSWWAQQESSWGGWWNWDSSETLGLLMLLQLFVIRHYLIFSWKDFSAFNFFSVLSIFFFLLTGSYLLVQLSFELTSHNFGIKFFYFFNNNFLFVELLYLFFVALLAFLAIFFFCKMRFSVSVNFQKKKPFRIFFFLIKNLLVLSVTLLVLCALTLSFSQPISFFLWNFLSINLLNVSPVYDFFLFLWVLIFAFLTGALYASLAAALWFILTTPVFYTPVYLLVFSFKKKQKVNFIHFFLILFFTSEVFSQNSLFVYETFYARYGYFSSNSNLFRYDVPSYILNFLFLEKNLFFKSLSVDNALLSLNNVFSFSGNNGFSYFSNAFNFLNFVFININYTSSHLWNEILFLPNLWILAWASIFALCVKASYLRNCTTELSTKLYRRPSCLKIDCLLRETRNIDVFFRISA